jgi:mercuric ion binding protein
MKFKSFVALALLLASTYAAAAEKTITLDVSDMTCAACPITVKKALNNVTGVSKVSVSLEKKQAVVTYDDSKAQLNGLLNATFEAGYPSTLNSGTAQ